MRRLLPGLLLALAMGPAAAGSAAITHPLLASDLLEMQVRNADNDYFGAINDLLVDGTGRISYVVLRMGGLLGMGNRRYVVPWSRLQIEAGRNSVLLDIPPDHLATEFPVFDERAPGGAVVTGRNRRQ